MKKTLLQIDEVLYDELIAHLLPQDMQREEAAFLFVKGGRDDRQMVFRVVETLKLKRKDFARQANDYIEMDDESSAAVIKRAHDLEACLVEMHSHLGPWPAGFSLADRAGLRETVPHMWWRLQRRPYLAIVVANGSFDALVWLDNPKVPCSLDGLLVGETVMKPTNNSLTGWR
ncbi:MAG: Mov34/MPN/PAD-1 family protein [Proteobacteria bacterium]|nr:Mov34/MPN/PAD-1 family protein [Pseudomonadota bacterium]